MSSLFSQRYLRFRKAAEGGPIEADLPCRTCGYNLRGLNFGRNCPECGNPILSDRTLTDALIEGGLEHRARMRRGLGLLLLSLIVLLASRIVYFFVNPFVIGSAVTKGYVLTGAANALLWLIAVWLVTPPKLDETWSDLALLRRAMRVLHLAWPVAFIVLQYRHFTTVSQGTDQALFGIGMSLRGLGCIGVLLLLVLLRRLAEHADLDDAARRLNVALWLLWLPTLIAQLFPDPMPWFALVPFGFVIFFWCWLVTLMLLGVLEMYRHSQWVEQHAADSVQRDARMIDTRRELDEQLEASIRPLPKSQPDIPLTEKKTPRRRGR